jgi:hypothetical protein
MRIAARLFEKQRGNCDVRPASQKARENRELLARFLEGRTGTVNPWTALKKLAAKCGFPPRFIKGRPANVNSQHAFRMRRWKYDSEAAFQEAPGNCGFPSRLQKGSTEIASPAALLRRQHRNCEFPPRYLESSGEFGESAPRDKFRHTFLGCCASLIFAVLNRHFLACDAATWPEFRIPSSAATIVRLSRRTRAMIWRIDADPGSDSQTRGSRCGRLESESLWRSPQYSQQLHKKAFD